MDFRKKRAIFTIFLVFLAFFSCYCQALAKDLNAQMVNPLDIEEEFIQFLQANAPWNLDEMEISNIKILPSKIWVPGGEVKFEFSEPRSSTYLGRISSLVTIYVNDRPVRRARACAYIECFRKVACARTGLVKGQVIRESDIKLVRMAISKLKGKYFESVQEIAGLAARHSLRPGQVIYGRSVMKPIVIKRGSKVLIVAKSANLEITCPGIAVEKGGIGDFVRVKNLQSKRVIIAQVKDDRTVYVSF